MSDYLTRLTQIILYPGGDVRPRSVNPFENSKLLSQPVIETIGHERSSLDESNALEKSEKNPEMHTLRSPLSRTNFFHESQKQNKTAHSLNDRSEPIGQKNLRQSIFRTEGQTIKPGDNEALFPAPKLTATDPHGRFEQQSINEPHKKNAGIQSAHDSRFNHNGSDPASNRPEKNHPVKIPQFNHAQMSRQEHDEQVTMASRKTGVVSSSHRQEAASTSTSTPAAASLRSHIVADDARPNLIEGDERITIPEKEIPVEENQMASFHTTTLHTAMRDTQEPTPAHVENRNTTEPLPDIKVSIGRIEIRASAPPDLQPIVQSHPRKPAVSLQQYIARRNKDK
jgi:hypothetical protein